MTDQYEIGATNPADLRIMDVGELAPGTEWTALSDAYLIYPDQTTFTPSSLLSISMDDIEYRELYRYSPVIVMYGGDRWASIESGRDGKWVNARITKGGRYALVTPKVPASSQPTSGNPTGSGTIIPGSSPTGPAPTTASEPSPGLSGTQPGITRMTQTPKSGPSLVMVLALCLTALALVSVTRKRG
jgi:hypothetical protein